MTWNRIVMSAALAASTLFALPASAESYRLLHSWDRSTEPGTAYIIENFIPRLAEAIPGATAENFGPESVPPFEQLEPLQAGVFDFLYTHTAYHFGTTRGSFGADAIDGSAAQRREAGVWDEIDKHYQGVGAKLIAMITVPGGFHIQMREALVDGKMAGRAVRGTNVYQAVVEALGGTIVVLPIGEVFTALERGAVDGASSPLIGSVALGWNKEAPYLVRPRFGTSTTYLFMNMARYQALPADQQEALLALGKEIETGGEARMLELVDKEEKDLIAAGSKVTEIAPEFKDKLKQIWADGLFKLSAETDPAAAESLRAIARKAGLVN